MSILANLAVMVSRELWYIRKRFKLLPNVPHMTDPFLLDVTLFLTPNSLLSENKFQLSSFLKFQSMLSIPTDHHNWMKKAINQPLNQLY